MDEGSFHDPLISNVDDARSSPVEKKRPLLLLTLKWIFKIAMWAIFVAWAAFLFLYPAHFVKSFFQKWIAASEGTVFGITGSVFLLFSGPILLIAILAILYLIVFEEGELHVPQKKTRKSLRFRLWTFPALVDGPFGVVSAAEFIGILMFIAFVVWSVAYYTVSNLNLLSEIPLSPKWRSSEMLELTGLRFGLIGLFCLAFLFLPIARGSVLLRFIEIPFEQATRYHVWLGHLTMSIFTLHGLFYIIGWAMQGRLIHEILEWRNIGVANLAGVISLIAGLFMWVTSLPPVRKQNFELFFYTHQLYMVFVLFLALHVGDFIFSMAAGGIFLFMLDRFLRFCQSRRIVDVVSATCFPCGTMEVVLAKPKSLQYNALSFIFLQFRELSWLQWHPFSVSSSPLDGNRHLSVLIKVLGGWTSKLRRQICLDGAAAQFGLPFQPHSRITASVEGPYGHEVPYHLMYENLILVAGGIGISPFLAILRDILHLIKGGKSCLPKNILIIWAVKTSDELSLLSVRDMESICPSHTDKLNLEIQMFVTREDEPPLEEGKKPKGTNPFVIPVSSGCGMSGLVGTGDRVWSGLYVASSIAGFIILMALVDIYYINPYKVSYWWYKGLLFVLCMIASVAIFGGLVVAFWKLWEGRVSTLAGENPSDDDLEPFKSVLHAEPLAPDNLWLENFATLSSLTYGRRPDFKGIFDMISDRWGKVDIGVIVCGPPTLQTSIAKECRSHGLNRTPYSPIFHFYSHTFDL